MKDNIPWMRAQHGLKGFKFQTDNGEFNSKACKDLVAASGGKLITNCPYSPETMSIIERSWRTIREMASVYNRVPPAKAKRAGLRQSPFDKMHGEIPSLDDFHPFGCWGYALIPVHGKAHKRRSEQGMYMRKEFGKVGGRELESIILLPTPSVRVVM